MLTEKEERKKERRTFSKLQKEKIVLKPIHKLCKFFKYFFTWMNITEIVFVLFSFRQN